MTLTQASLQELLSYDPDTGVFTRKVASGRSVKVGDGAGFVDNQGYVVFWVNNKPQYAHRLAWLYTYGIWPKGDIDHLNGIKADNRIANLEDKSRRGNQSNRRCHREGHLVGTTFHKQKQMWRAQIQINGKRKHIGYFLTRELASQAYQNELASLPT